MKYYTFTPPGTKAILVGVDKQEVSASVNPFLASIGRKKIIPLGLNITEIEHLRISVSNPTQFSQITASVREGIDLVMGYSGFEFLYFLSCSETDYREFLKKHKLGRLYCYEIRPQDNSWLFSDYILQGIRGYNWDQHAEWLARLHAAMDKRFAQAKPPKDEVFTFGFRDPKK